MGGGAVFEIVSALRDVAIALLLSWAGVEVERTGQSDCAWDACEDVEAQPARSFEPHDRLPRLIRA